MRPTTYYYLFSSLPLGQLVNLFSKVTLYVFYYVETKYLNQPVPLTTGYQNLFTPLSNVMFYELLILNLLRSIQHRQFHCSSMIFVVSVNVKDHQLPEWCVRGHPDHLELLTSYQSLYSSLHVVQVQFINIRAVFVRALYSHCIIPIGPRTLLSSHQINKTLFPLRPVS